MNLKGAPCRSRQTGVTLVELLITMTIAGILLGMGVSGYKYVTKANRASSEINALLGDMQFARYEAVKEGLPVKICPAATISSTTCDANQTWSEGWIVLSNALSGTTGTANVLRRQLPFSSFHSTDTLSTSASAANSTVTFNREGFASGLPATGVVFSLHDSSSTASYTRCLVLGMSGVMQTGLASSQYSPAVQIFGQTCS
jgi:type IV fimbrial biogenesis protein FimT